ncbi:MAG: hypothetical protein HWN67_13985 [Candidatus Helarchaeota archaeon]|nr:hypothetical protein [Candidatus Helarchaeota archaeon]
MKEFAELRELISEKIDNLQNKIKELQNELNSYTNILIKIDSILEKESFKTAAEIYEPEPKEVKLETKPAKPSEAIIDKEFEIKSSEDKILGKMVVKKDTIMITPTSNIKVPENAPPFKTFFLGRILKQMEDEDQESIKNGKIDKNQAISYEITKSPENFIQNIIIKNYRSYNRMIKILDTISWTFRTILKPK